MPVVLSMMIVIHGFQQGRPVSEIENYQELKDIKLLFNAGTLRRCEVWKWPLGDGYTLNFSMTGQSAQISLAKQRGSVRIFKTIDAAVGVAKVIGFHQVEVFSG